MGVGRESLLAESEFVEVGGCRTVGDIYLPTSHCKHGGSSAGLMRCPLYAGCAWQLSDAPEHV